MNSKTGLQAVLVNTWERVSEADLRGLVTQRVGGGVIFSEDTEGKFGALIRAPTHRALS